MNILNNYKNSIYASVFIKPLSWCDIWNNFYVSGIDIGYVCNREKALESLGLRGASDLFFHPGDER